MFAHRNLMIHTKIAVYNVDVISIILHGYESWIQYHRHIRLLEYFHIRCPQLILGLHWWNKVTNSEIKSRVGIPSIESVLQHRQLIWLGHVIRMPESRLHHHMLYDQLRQGHDDLFLSLNKGNIYVLALHDFSSAFDTIDHSILEHRLHTDFGFTDTVLQWFSFYLTDCTHYASLSNRCSAFAPVHSDVPQGSSSGPYTFHHVY